MVMIFNMVMLESKEFENLQCIAIISLKIFIKITPPWANASFLLPPHSFRPHNFFSGFTANCCKQLTSHFAKRKH